MNDADLIIAAKFNELVQRSIEERGIHSFTKPERAIWFLVLIRTEIDMNGFNSVFDQVISRSELQESIGYMEELGLIEIANWFQQVLDRLDERRFYDRDGNPQKIAHRKELSDEIEHIGSKVTREDILWEIDPKLAKLLEN